MEANVIDVSVGQRLKKARNSLGLTQSEIAKLANVTYQQIQKYENGSNRIGASKLHQFSTILKVDINYFFQDLTGKNIFKIEDTLKDEKETLKVLQTYYKISNPTIRKNFLTLIKSINEDF